MYTNFVRVVMIVDPTNGLRKAVPPAMTYESNSFISEQKLFIV